MTSLISYSESINISGVRYKIFLFPTTSYWDCTGKHMADAFEAYLTDDYHTSALLLFKCPSLNRTPELLMELAVARAIEYVKRLKALQDLLIPDDEGFHLASENPEHWVS